MRATTTTSRAWLVRQGEHREPVKFGMALPRQGGDAGGPRRPASPTCTATGSPAATGGSEVDFAAVLTAEDVGAYKPAEIKACSCATASATRSWTSTRRTPPPPPATWSRRSRGRSTTSCSPAPSGSCGRCWRVARRGHRDYAEGPLALRMALELVRRTPPPPSRGCSREVVALLDSDGDEPLRPTPSLRASSRWPGGARPPGVAASRRSRAGRRRHVPGPRTRQHVGVDTFPAILERLRRDPFDPYWLQAMRRAD